MNHQRSTKRANLQIAIEAKFESVPLFAERVGLSKGFVYNVLSGRQCPTLDTAAAMANALGISLDELHVALGRPPLTRPTAGIA